jgi:hypothetical protein
MPYKILLWSNNFNCHITEDLSVYLHWWVVILFLCAHVVLLVLCTCIQVRKVKVGSVVSRFHVPKIEMWYSRWVVFSLYCRLSIITKSSKSCASTFMPFLRYEQTTTCPAYQICRRANMHWWLHCALV